MNPQNPTFLAMASGDLYVKLLRTIPADRRVPDRGTPAKSRLLRLQKENLISEHEAKELAALIDVLANETDGTRQKTRIDGIYHGLVDCNASPVAIAISSIARYSISSENELLDTPIPKDDEGGTLGVWHISPESHGYPVTDQVEAAIAGACVGAAVPGEDASTAVLASIIGAAFVGAFFQP